jgi:hypothetical protein
MTRIVVNIVAFQIGWWATIGGAAIGYRWAGVAVVAAIYLLHLFNSGRATTEAWFVPLAAAIGFAADSVLAAAGVLNFRVPTWEALPAPLWIAAAWLNFATLINVTFRSIRENFLLATVIGFLSGPIAYWGGSMLGVVSIEPPWLGYVAIAVTWGAVLPVQFALASRIDDGSPDRTAAAVTEER